MPFCLNKTINFSDLGFRTRICIKNHVSSREIKNLSKDVTKLINTMWSLGKWHAADGADANAVTSKGAVASNLGNVILKGEGLLRADSNTGAATDAFSLINDNYLRHVSCEVEWKAFLIFVISTTLSFEEWRIFALENLGPLRSKFDMIVNQWLNPENMMFWDVCGKSTSIVFDSCITMGWMVIELLCM